MLGLTKLTLCHDMSDSDKKTRRQFLFDVQIMDRFFYYLLIYFSKHVK